MVKLSAEQKTQLMRLSAFYYFLGYLEARQPNAERVKAYKERNVERASKIANDRGTAEMFSDCITRLYDQSALHCKIPSL